MIRAGLGLMLIVGMAVPALGCRTCDNSLDHCGPLFTGGCGEECGSHCGVEARAGSVFSAGYVEEAPDDPQPTPATQPPAEEVPPGKATPPG